MGVSPKFILPAHSKPDGGRNILDCPHVKTEANPMPQPEKQFSQLEER